MKKTFKKAALISALACAFMVAMPQSANAFKASDFEHGHLQSIDFVLTMDGLTYWEVTTREGQHIVYVEDGYGNIIDAYEAGNGMNHL